MVRRTSRCGYCAKVADWHEPFTEDDRQWLKAMRISPD